MLRVTLEELIGAWEANDAHRASAFFAPEATYREPGHDPFVGRVAIFEHFKRFFRDGPAWRFHVDEIIIDGNRAALLYRFEITGTDGEWSSRFGCAFVRGESGLITEWREFSA